MGNSPSTSSKLPSSASANFHPEVEVVQAKSFDAHYGEVKIVKDKRTSQQYIVKDVVSNTKQAFEQDLRFYSERVNVKHPNVVSVLGYTSEDKHNFCSTYYKISIFIEPLDHHLQTDFESRKAGKVYYTESELLTIADNLISGLSYFESQGHSHGDIRPFNIFYKDRIYKLSDPSLTPQKGYNALNLAVIQGAKTLLAPEWLQQVPSSNLEIKGNKSRADVYSLGQTLLALATLLNSEDAYDYKHGTISQNLVKERLQLVANRYSDFTYHLIKDMLILDPAGRPDFVTLSNRLLPHQQEIRAGHHLAFFDQHHQHHDHHGYHHDHHEHHHHDHDHHHHEEQFVAQPVVVQHHEVAKRSALPAETHHVDAHYTPVQHTPVVVEHHHNDDLEARIRAALERSAATFKTIETKDHHTPAYSTTHYTSTYTTPQVDRHVDYTPARTAEVVKSHARPVETHHVETYKPVETHHHHVETYKPVETHHVETYKPVETHHVDTYKPVETHHHHHDVAPSTYQYTSTYVPTSTYQYTPSHHVDYSSTYTAPTSYTHTVAPVVDVHHSQHHVAPVVDVHHSQHYVAPVVDVHHSQHHVAPVVDVHHSQHHVERPAEEKVVKSFAGATDVHKSYVAPTTDIHHSYAAPASYTTYTHTATPVVDVHHSTTPVDVHHADRSAEVERIVRSSQHFNPEPAHHGTTNYSYSTYTAPASYSTYTPATYTTDVHHSQHQVAPVVDVHHSHHNVAPVVDVHHSHHNVTPVVTTEERVVRSTPKHVDYTYTTGAPASYTTTTYSNGHHFTPTDVHYSTGPVGGDIHHQDSIRTVEYHH